MYSDVLEFDVIGKAIGAYQKVLSKNFRKLNLAKPKKNVPKEQPNQPTKGDSQQPENFAETLDNLSDDYNRIIRESEVLDNVEWVKGRKTSGDAVNYHLSKKPFNKNGFKPPYKANSMVEDVTVEVNEKVYCVETLDAQRPGGWLTDKPLNSLDEVRDKLALIEDFKSSKDKLVIREYRVKKAFNTRKGIVGEQYETKGINAGKEYQGGANQIEFGAYMKNWTDYFEEVSKLSDNVNRAYIIKLNFND